jgi:uncharacterized OB-fold protein
MTPIQRMAEGATRGKMALQRCTDCGAVQYPPRELCVACLSDGLEWHEADAEVGEVLASTVLHHSHNVAFVDALPLRVGLVRLDQGPTVVCFLNEDCAIGMRVRVTAHNDAAGRPVMTAAPEVSSPEAQPRAATAAPTR